MLWQRVITALVLLALFVPAFFHPSAIPFAAFTLLLIAGAGREWARLNGCGKLQAYLAGLGLGLGLGLLWWVQGLNSDQRWLWPWFALFWVLLAPWLLHRGVEGWGRLARPLRLALGAVLLTMAWWALVQAKVVGVGMVLSILMLVWAADIAAYFGGKRFGRRKLSPGISPGKTWEGVFSAALAVLLLAALWLLLWPTHWGTHLYAELWALGPLLGLLALLGLLGMSVAGDLLESMVKRSAGMKDSGRILPGHGGVLDRFDSLLPVLPLAMWLASL